MLTREQQIERIMELFGSMAELDEEHGLNARAVFSRFSDNEIGILFGITGALVCLAAANAPKEYAVAVWEVFVRVYKEIDASIEHDLHGEN